MAKLTVPLTPTGIHKGCVTIGVVGLNNKVIVVAALEHPAQAFATTDTVPTFVPLGVKVMEFVVLVPPHPDGLVHV